MLVHGPKSAIYFYAVEDISPCLGAGTWTGNVPSSPESMRSSIKSSCYYNAIQLRDMVSIAHVLRNSSVPRPADERQYWVRVRTYKFTLTKSIKRPRHAAHSPKFQLRECYHTSLMDSPSAAPRVHRLPTRSQILRFQCHTLVSAKRLALMLPSTGSVSHRHRRPPKRGQRFHLLGQ